MPYFVPPTIMLPVALYDKPILKIYSVLYENMPTIYALDMDIYLCIPSLIFRKLSFPIST